MNELINVLCVLWVISSVKGSNLILNNVDDELSCQEVSTPKHDV